MGLLALLAAAPSLASNPFAKAPAAFLPADEAFQVSGRWVDQAIELTWVIAPGYYLYASRLQVTVPREEAWTLGTPRLPAPQRMQDPFFGEQPVYREVFTGRWPVHGGRRGVSRLQLHVRYQGCAEAGLCYPMQSRTLTIDRAP